MLCLLAISVSHAQDSLIINGTIDKSLNDKILVLNSNYSNHTQFSNPIISKECVIKQGKFSFRVGVKTLESYTIAIKDNEDKHVKHAYFTLLPRLTEINFLDTTFNNYEVKGNEVDKEAKKLGSKMNRRLYAQYEINKFLISSIEENPNSPLNIGSILSLIGKVPEEKINYLYSLLSDKAEESSRGKDLKFIINHLFIGKTIPNFKQLDPNGTEINITDFRGKYVLIDFWASWCLPCRAENPYLIKAYKKYNSKFEILSIASDSDRKLWLDAIKNDGTGSWKHTSDLKGIENYVTWNIFKITAIPSNYLIDQNGKIIAKDLRGQELLVKLEELHL